MIKLPKLISDKTEELLNTSKERIRFSPYVLWNGCMA